MRGPLRLLIASTLLAAPVFAKTKCPPREAGGLSADWGNDFRERVRAVFEAAKVVAGTGVDPATQLVYWNDLPGESQARVAHGSPAEADPRGYNDFENDTVVYTFGLLEIACDEAQLATIFLHELKHLKRDEHDWNHLNRLALCQDQLWKKNAYPETPAGRRRFKTDYLTQCSRPIEEEADSFAYAAARNLPYSLQEKDSGSDANRDARALAFRNLEKWGRALGDSGEDPGHGSIGKRAEKAENAALIDSMLRRQQETSDKMSRMPVEFQGDASSEKVH